VSIVLEFNIFGGKLIHHLYIFPIAKDYPDMELVLGAGSLSGDRFGTMRNLLGITDEFYDYMFGDLQNKETFGLVPVLLRPKSRGRISLRSRNPFHWPKMEPNFMQHPDDVRAMIEGVEMVKIYFHIYFKF